MPERPATLDAARPVLALYYRALAGESRVLAAHHDPNDAAQFPDTRGTIRLPQRERLAWYRIALAHRALHHDLGTFRLRLAGLADSTGAFLRLFAESRLALECFTALEDLRVDAALARRYPGLAADLRAVQAEELAARAALDTLAPRALLLELVVRASLGWRGDAEVPARLAATARELLALALPLARGGATAEDAARATRQAYARLVHVPQLLDTRERSRVAAVEAPVADVAIVLPEPERPRLEGDTILATDVAPVRYRDSLEARFADRAAPAPMDQEAIFRARALEDAVGGAGAGAAEPISAGEDPIAPAGPRPHEHHDLGADEAHEDAAGELEPDAPRSYVYPEWDHRAGRYRERWVRVRETTAPSSGSTRAYHDALREHGALVADIRRRFERVAPEALRRVRAVRDGDELDLDAAVDALADLRAGVMPSDRVYVARERTQRDVAVALLIDLSSSTAERLDPSAARRYQRILDVEIESLVLLSEALTRVGDAFALYGFSGTGRADVRFVILKDLAEPAARAMARLDALAPIHTTRMGAAIRHATSKLRRSGYATRLLMVVSDGRPFDREYGQQYGDGAEVDYAVADTRAALDEARASGVRPFLLTVDRSGADYLREMSGGLDYEVLDDVSQLPARLLALYRRLARG